jgi:hypothetical protein
MRLPILFAAAFVSFGLVLACLHFRRKQLNQGAFAAHLAQLSQRIGAAPPGSAERAALEAEYRDVESAQADLPTIERDLATASAKGPAAKKAAAATEATALMQRHGSTAFEGVALSQTWFLSDPPSRGALLAWLVIFVCATALVVGVPCATPLPSVCLTPHPSAFTCGFDATGACVMTN